MTDEARASLERALPAYEIAERLGEGAFGVVYEGRHSQLGRPVAIKQLPRMYAEDDNVRERFVAEAQMVASLDHPHVVPVYDFVESEGSRYLIMERCEGSISDKFKSEGIVTDEACAAVLACLAGLDVAHSRGLLHRDVKPENLMYDAKGVVKLADFGIARDTGTDTRRTATGMIVGTPAYMSPEQCRGDNLTPASDVYSVGMMAYELLTGGLPFPESDSVNGLLAHHLVTEPLPMLAARPELPGSIGEVIDRSLSKDLDIRYSSAEEFARALARACVQAFGSGWLRRRRFVLHWPEIIAETERPADNSPRTGTIMVRSGDLTHDFEAPPVPTGESTAAPAQPAPQPVAAVGGPAPEAATSLETPTVPAGAAPPSIGNAAPGTTADGSDRSGPPWPLIGVVGAAIVALIVGIVVVAGGGDDGTEITSAVPTPTVPSSAQGVVGDAGTEITSAVPTPTVPSSAQGVVGDAGEQDAGGAGAGDAEQQDDAGGTGSDENDPVGEPTPVTIDADSGDFNFVPTEQPEGVDLTELAYYGAPRPCPEDQFLVACIYAAVVDPDTDEMTVLYWVEGFVPELEPADYHLHFYIDNLVDGDENKAGSGATGGSWRLWDAPFPATSFGGENGRTIFTGSEFLAANGRNLCLLVAELDHVAIPGSGNCITPFIATDDAHLARFQASLTEGQYIGTCSLGVTAGVPNSWRWFDLTGDLDEIARRVRPTQAAQTADLLGQLVDIGAVIYADGPAQSDGFTPNLSLSIWPGDFTMNSTPREVADELDQLGIGSSDQTRLLGDREVVTATQRNPNGSVSKTFVIPDYGYAIGMTFTASPAGEGVMSDLADQIAATILGC